MEFIINPALEKLHRRLGLRLREIEDPEEIIDELRAIYDVKYERPKLREEFEGRDQRSGETLRDYLEILQSLHKEVDKGSSVVGTNTAVFQRFYAGLREPELRHPAQRQKIQAEANRVDIEDKDFLEKMLRFTEAEKQGARAVSREAARNPRAIRRHRRGDL